MRLQDYTRKTQEVAKVKSQAQEEAQKHVATTRQQYTNNLQLLQKAVEKLVLPEIGAVNMQQLADQDPAEYWRVKAKHDTYSQTLQSISQELQKVQAEQKQEADTQFAQAKEQAAVELQTRLPNLNDETKQAIFKTGIEYGYSKEEVGSVIDPRAIHVLHDAYKWRELQAKKPSVEKRVMEAPKILKAGAKSNQQSSAANRESELKQRLKQSGGKDEKAAQALIQNRLFGRSK